MPVNGGGHMVSKRQTQNKGKQEHCKCLGGQNGGVKGEEFLKCEKKKIWL